jgi:hypothetical protein
MRHLILSAVALATLSACSASTAEQGQRSLKAQQELDRYLQGKVAGAPQSCLPNYRANDMTVIDERTILFREGSRVWRNDIPGGCTGLGRPGTALVTRQFGGSGLCRGEIAQVVDTVTGTFVGSCSLGDFVPFTGPRRS